MAWSTPLTAVSNATLTAAQWNASVRDNLLETAAAKATTAGSFVVVSGANSLAERPCLSDTVTTSEATTSTSFVDLTTIGPRVTATTGDKALIMYAVQMACNAAAGISIAAWMVSGATSVPPDDDKSINLDQDGTAANQDMRAADVRRLTGLTPGSNVVSVQYRTTAGTSTFRRRHLIVIGL